MSPTLQETLETLKTTAPTDRKAFEQAWGHLPSGLQARLNNKIASSEAQSNLLDDNGNAQRYRDAYAGSPVKTRRAFFEAMPKAVEIVVAAWKNDKNPALT